MHSKAPLREPGRYDFEGIGAAAPAFVGVGAVTASAVGAASVGVLDAASAALQSSWLLARTASQYACTKARTPSR